MTKEKLKNIAMIGGVSFLLSLMICMVIFGSPSFSKVEINSAKTISPGLDSIDERAINGINPTDTIKLNPDDNKGFFKQ